MYCTKCGKQIDYDAIVCNECLEKERLENLSGDTNEFREEELKSEPEYREVPKYQYDMTEEAAPAQSGTSNPRMFGFGRALTSTILGFIGWIFSYIALIVCAVAISEEDAIAAGIVLNLFATGLSVPSLILGIKSVIGFKSRVSKGAVKPIPSLILGIVGLSFSALALFFVFISLVIVSLA